MNHCSIAFAIVIACTVATKAGASPHASFDYNTTDQDRGPAHWFALTEIANNTCGGDKQSPIDIETRLMETSGCDLYMDYKFMVSSARPLSTCWNNQTILYNCWLATRPVTHI